jgi:type III pantothenate kinase
MTIALVDIGNTTIKAKLYNKNHAIVTCHVNRDVRSLSLFFKAANIRYYLISSVVPSINLKIKEINNQTAFFLEHHHFSDLKNHVVPKTSVGIDRLVNAVAVQHIWNANAVIIDAGTVVTFCRVKKSGHYLGGIIVPGFQMIRNALFNGAEQLPLVDFPLKAPGLIGESTKGAIESGLYYGAIEMINGITRQIVNTEPNIAVILTGGVPPSLLNSIDHNKYEPELQFRGLKILHDKFKDTLIGLSGAGSDSN